LNRIKRQGIFILFAGFAGGRRSKIPFNKCGKEHDEAKQVLGYFP